MIISGEFWLQSIWNKKSSPDDVVPKRGSRCGRRDPLFPMQADLDLVFDGLEFKFQVFRRRLVLAHLILSRGAVGSAFKKNFATASTHKATLSMFRSSRVKAQYNKKLNSGNPVRQPFFGRKSLANLKEEL